MPRYPVPYNLKLAIIHRLQTPAVHQSTRIDIVQPHFSSYVFSERCNGAPTRSSKMLFLAALDQLHNAFFGSTQSSSCLISFRSRDAIITLRTWHAWRKRIEHWSHKLVGWGSGSTLARTCQQSVVWWFTPPPFYLLWQFTRYLHVTNLLPPLPPTKAVSCVIISM